MSNACKHENGHRWSDKGDAWYCKDGCGHHMTFNPHHAGEVKPPEDWREHVLSIPRVTPLQEKTIVLKSSKY
jgi:hypothetical protein